MEPEAFCSLNVVNDVLLTQGNINMSETTGQLHNTYRPKSLDEVIGNEKAVTALKGIIKSGKWPSAIAFFGQPSAGKTTLSQCLAADALGVPNLKTSDYTYVNMGDSRGIDDVRQLVQNARLAPSGGKRRFIHLDEVQAILSNPAAAACLLMPLENPHPRMTWILSSMSPEKFNSTQNGKAILSRSAQFHLQGYTDAELAKQANRIIKGEQMGFMTKELRDLVVAECNGEMRTLANLLEGLASYYAGLDDQPDKLPIDAANEVLRVSVGDDDKVAVRLLTSIYAGKMKNVLLELLNITDAFSVISKMIYTNSVVLNDLALGGQRHQKVWMTVAAKALKDNLQSEKIKKYNLSILTSMQVALIDLKGQAQTFAVPEDQAILRFAANFIQENS